MNSFIDDSFEKVWLKVTEEMKVNAELLERELDNFDHEAFQHDIESLNFEVINYIQE